MLPVSDARSTGGAKLSERSSPLNMTVRDLGRGFDPSFASEENVLPDVAICTPERLDALLRLSSANSTAGARAADLFTSSNVIVFDELQTGRRTWKRPPV